METLWSVRVCWMGSVRKRTWSSEFEKGERRVGVRFGAKARERTSSLRPRQHKLYGFGHIQVPARRAVRWYGATSTSIIHG
jgi:hypothetical protein